MTDDPVTFRLSSAATTRAFGMRLARLLRAGDVVVLTGDLGAGKTTLTQGIGAGLDVRSLVTSPTFVLSRVHPPLGDGPGLVHVDAYRLQGGGELDDLDLDETLPDAVTVVEWGEGLADRLSADRLHIRLTGHPGDDLADVRTLTVVGVGDRWSSVAWHALLQAGLG